jgi:RNA polymerase sigma factor (sigma-70 family)
VATGGPVGALGDADLRAIRVQPLNAAIEQTMKTGCHTGEARRALVTALIVMRLRSALVAQDFKLMATVLEEAEGQEQQGGSDALLPQARGELAFCRATMEFRATLEALGRATESQSEPELVEALGRAQKLGMAEHPRAHVKQAGESATMSLTRIQHAKTALAVSVRNMDGRALLDALAMAASVGMRHELVDEAKRVMKISKHPISLDRPIGESDDSYFGDFIEDESVESPVSAASREMLRERIENVLSTLTFREREIIKLRYGIGDGYTYTLEEVGRIFRVTRERVRQIEAKAVRKLQHPVRARRLGGFLDSPINDM